MTDKASAPSNACDRPSAPRDHQGRVLANEKISSNFWLLRLEVPDFPPARPGQFVQFQCRRTELDQPFLRRPFSIMDRDGDRLDFVYKSIGPGTRFLERLGTGDTLALLGPLGEGFRLDLTSSDNVLTVAGGTGLGGVLYWIKEVARRGISQRFIFGVRRREELPVRFLADLPVELEAVVEDEDGFVTPRLEALAPGYFTRAAVCGPTPMMRAVAEALTPRVERVELSLEEMMGCGFGICYTCPVRAADRDDYYYSACVDGPVFAAERIILGG